MVLCYSRHFFGGYSWRYMGCFFYVNLDVNWDSNWDDNCDANWDANREVNWGVN